MIQCEHIIHQEPPEEADMRPIVPTTATTLSDFIRAQYSEDQYAMERALAEYATYRPNLRWSNFMKAYMKHREELFEAMYGPEWREDFPYSPYWDLYHLNKFYGAVVGGTKADVEWLLKVCFTEAEVNPIARKILTAMWSDYRV